MESSKRKLARKWISSTLALFIFILIAIPHELPAKNCRDAFIECVVDMGIKTVLGAIGGFIVGNIMGAVVGSTAIAGSGLLFCVMGYDFCKRYYTI